jgi:DNA adenine methylase
MLGVHRNAHRREKYYYEIRDIWNEGGWSDDPSARASVFIYLNKTCLNGLWRVNSAGKNNVPFGRYATPKILDVEALRAANRALKGVKLKVADFAKVTEKLGKGDFVYFDPPYVPVSKTASFTSYAKDGFGPKEQERLRDLLHLLKKRSVGAMLSNALTPETEELYRGFVIERVPMPRSINSDPGKRGEMTDNVDVLANGQGHGRSVANVTLDQPKPWKSDQLRSIFTFDFS